MRRDWTESIRPKLFARAMSLCGGNRADADDLVQSIMERVVKRGGEIDEIESPEAYCMRALSNEFVEQCRKNAVRTSAGQASELAGREELIVLPPALVNGPRWDHITPPQVRAAIDQLPKELRETLLLREYHDLSYEEIAAQLGIPKSTVGTRLVRAREKLVELLSPLLDPKPPGGRK